MVLLLTAAGAVAVPMMAGRTNGGAGVGGPDMLDEQEPATRTQHSAQHQSSALAPLGEIAVQHGLLPAEKLVQTARP